MTDSILEVTERSAKELLERLKGDVGGAIMDQNVKAVMLIGLSLSEKVGSEAFDILEAVLEGEGFDESILSQNLSLKEMSDLLDIAQGIEARQREALGNIIASLKTAGVQVASIVIRAAFLAA